MGNKNSRSINGTVANGKNNKFTESQVILSLSTLPKFDMKKQDFATFANSFIGAMASTNVSLDVKIAKGVFAMLFLNEERILYNSISDQLKTNEDWEGYLDALCHVFHTPENIGAARDELARMKQRSGESVLNFRSRIERTAAFAYPFTSTERKIHTLDYFIGGLKESIRWKIEEIAPESIIKAFEMAFQIEAMERIKNNEKKEDEGDETLHQINAISMTGEELCCPIFILQILFRCVKKYLLLFRREETAYRNFSKRSTF